MFYFVRVVDFFDLNRFCVSPGPGLLQMPRKKRGAAKNISQLAAARAAKQEKIEKGQTVLNWSSKGGQKKGSSGRARDGPQMVTIFMFCAKQLLEQWGLVVL